MSKHSVVKQSDQILVIFWTGPEKLHPSWKPGIIFQSLEFSEISLNYFSFILIFKIYNQHLAKEGTQLRPEFCFGVSNVLDEFWSEPGKVVTLVKLN